MDANVQVSCHHNIHIEENMQSTYKSIRTRTLRSLCILDMSCGEDLSLYALTLLSLSFILFLFIVLILIEVKGFLRCLPIIYRDDSAGFWFP